MKKTWKILTGLAVVLGLAFGGTSEASPLYMTGVSAPCSGCIFGTHLAQGPTGSVPGVGGGGINSAAGSALDGNRTYIYDQAGWVDGTVSRGDSDFAMLVWDLGFGNALDTVRLYTHQDHYSGGPINDGFTAQDVMEYSVWGSNDNITFSLLSDVVGFNLNGGSPLYTFSGTDPSIIYRGGSTEFGTLNAYTRDYTFGTAYRYYGVRSSTISIQAADADPELDALAFHQGPIVSAPEPASLILLGAGSLLMAGVARRRRQE